MPDLAYYSTVRPDDGSGTIAIIGNPMPQSQEVADFLLDPGAVELTMEYRDQSAKVLLYLDLRAAMDLHAKLGLALAVAMQTPITKELR